MKSGLLDPTDTYCYLERPSGESDQITQFTFVIRKQEKKGGAGSSERLEGEPVFFTFQTKTPMTKDLEIDFTLTFKELKNWFKAYNLKLKAEKPEQFRKLSLKSTHLETAKEIIRFYGAYLYKNKNDQYYGRRFWITNSGIAKEKLQHRATIYRHILVLEEAKVLTGKIFHGSNCGLEVEINPMILVAKSDIGRSFAMVDNQSGANGTTEQTKEILSAKKTFDYILNTTVATCNYNDSSLPLETKNVNMHQKGVDNFFLNFKGKKQETQSWKQGSKIPCNEPKEDFSSTSQGKEGYPHTAGGREKIELYTLHTWTFVKSALWKKHAFTPEQVEQSKQCIRDYYERIKPEKLDKCIDGLYNSYLERIMLAYQYVRKSPDRFIPVPWLYLDNKFRHGFAGTREWHKVMQARRKKDKNYYSNLSVLVKEYTKYKSNPSLTAFKEAEKSLQIKQDEQLMQLYYNCILDSDKFTHDFLQSKHTA